MSNRRPHRGCQLGRAIIGRRLMRLIAQKPRLLIDRDDNERWAIGWDPPGLDGWAQDLRREADDSCCTRLNRLGSGYVSVRVLTARLPSNSRERGAETLPLQRAVVSNDAQMVHGLFRRWRHNLKIVLVGGPTDNRAFAVRLIPISLITKVWAGLSELLWHVGVNSSTTRDLQNTQDRENAGNQRVLKGITPESPEIPGMHL